MSRIRTFAAAMAALLVVSPLAAQDVSQQQSAAVRDFTTVTASATAPLVKASTSNAPVAAQPTAIGPTAESGIAGIRTGAESTLPAPMALQSRRSSPALMIVGGAALLVGALIGGDAGTVVMVGGGIMGLVGLWTYLQ